MRHAQLSPALFLLVAACATTTVQTPPRDTRERPTDVAAGPGPGRSSSVHQLGVPPGQLPRVGQCRVWIPGVPPGRQSRSRDCRGILATAPAGSMILFRPTRGLVRVRYIHEQRVGVLIAVRIFGDNGLFVSEEEPSRSDRDEDDEEGGRGRRRP